MNIRTAALVFGIVFLLAGASGFVASPPPADAPPLTIEHGHGMALGLFPVNTVHNVVHLLFGVLGILAWNGTGTARGYFRLVGIAYLLLTVLGLIPATNTAFGFVPIWGNDVYLHGLLGAVAIYFGFIAPATPAPARV